MSIARRPARRSRLYGRPWLLAAGLWLAGIGASSAGLGAQTASVTELKAAFIYNFARFAEWPPDTLPAGATVVACVAGDDRVAEALSVIMRSRSADAGPMTLRRLRLDSEFQGCHLLYLGNLDIKRATAVVDTLSGIPALTVSDLHGFATIAGGVIELFQENDKMRFVINTRTADRLRIRLSSRLLSLATIVKEGAGVTQP